MGLALDHLVVAASELEQGRAALAARLGVPLQAGGRHAAMGTHNALLGLGGETYLELIAIDPQAPAPGRARWFGLDRPGLQAELAHGPRLLHWVARCDDLEAALARCPWPAGEILAMERGAYRWRIAVPVDGGLPLGGVAPTLLEWRGAQPAAALARSGCALHRLELRHPDAAWLRGVFRELGLQGPVDLVEASGAALVAELETPRGRVRLA